MYDYHSHSFFSDDSSVPLKNMIEAAISMGIKELAVTDHYDPDYPDKNFPFDLDFNLYHQALLAAEKEHSKNIKVVKGLEMGIQHGETNKKCYLAASDFPYDFIIGSFHCCGGQDLYSKYFIERSDEDGVREFYDYVYEGICDFNNFDVLGHINVIDRYVSKIPDYSQYMFKIEQILTKLINMGKGIELNTSSFRYGLGERTTPSKEILALYKSLGGEIITIGSDAHREKQLGYKYKEAIEILISHGFKYITTFDKRVAKQIKI
ncbi:MAG: histidinol-phosphatase HisJ family protein [Peptostreptococcaceae bacterium]|nr:histidinol-phosphatase HisJ family protein [Peptostreptococcaceae bacterium]